MEAGFSISSAALSRLVLFFFPMPAPSESPLIYEATSPPLEMTFAIKGGHYSGVVHPGSLFLQTDIPTAPLVRWPAAESGRFYTLILLDFDGNATGSWPDAVPSGKNSTVRHWIVGNLPGELLRTTGYAERTTEANPGGQPAVVQPYRSPRIPMVSDRYAAYLFLQDGLIEFSELPDQVTNFDYVSCLQQYGLTRPVAANYFVAIYTSESPFSGKPFHGNDVSATWHRDLGQGRLTPQKD